MGDITGNYVFLPWVRQGAAAGIRATDTRTADQPGAISVKVSLRINGSEEPTPLDVRLYGPGDVTGIDPRQIVRTEPCHLATDFEPNYFPAIDFDRPDFPWLFTPAKADGSNRLRPWLCLIVVRKQAGVELRSDRNLPLPVLDITAPADPTFELPDLAESWAWAHAQVIGASKAKNSLQNALAGNPALTVSRLVCPRRLDPKTDYLACVVPTFELGLKAGLGQPINETDEKTLKPAWGFDSQPTAPLMLPVYYHWEFRTGSEGDFETLAALLEPRQISGLAGKRPMNVGRPGFNVNPPLKPETIMELEGALRLFEAPTAGWPENSRLPFQRALQEILNAPWAAMTEENRDPLLAPPIYGCWQAAQHHVDVEHDEHTPQPWLDELNLDPRQRVAAALGTQVVQQEQEALMAAAWEQLGDIERINQILRQAQFGRAVNSVYHAKHFARLSMPSLLNMVTPAKARVVVTATAGGTSTSMLLSRRITVSAMPDRTLSAPLRRLARPRGGVSSRFQVLSRTSSERSIRISPTRLIDLLNTGGIVPSEQQATGSITINEVSELTPALRQRVRFENIAAALNNVPQLHAFGVSPEGDALTLLRPLLTPPTAPDSPDAKAFREAAGALQNYVAKAFLSFLTFPAPTLELGSLREELLQRLQPENTLAMQVASSLSMSAEAPPRADPLEPILDNPYFPRPMYEALRDLSQDFLFPGLEHVPPNTVALLETNPKFVESFMVGLNTEMSRELLWRNYPTDQRGTCFRQFWDTSAGSAQPDIAPIHTWGTHALGGNVQSGEQTVLLIRGELLRRYPNSVIYAVPAKEKNGRLDLSGSPGSEKFPLFRGTLKPDVTFLGFDLTPQDAVADPGWFFVIQQQPTEPRFGLDAPDFSRSELPLLASWNDLSWQHLAANAEAFQKLSHVATGSPPLKPPPANDPAQWGKNSAHLAYITLQRPLRIAIHAKDMLPASTS